MEEATTARVARWRRESGNDLVAGRLRWTLRAVITLGALDVFAQAVLAGAFLNGDFAMLGLHRTNANFGAATLGYVQVLVAGVYWGRAADRGGRHWSAWESPWPRTWRSSLARTVRSGSTCPWASRSAWRCRCWPSGRGAAPSDSRGPRGRGRPTSARRLSRRDFLGAAGGAGIAVGLGFGVPWLARPTQIGALLRSELPLPAHSWLRCRSRRCLLLGLTGQPTTTSSPSGSPSRRSCPACPPRPGAMRGSFPGPTIVSRAGAADAGAPPQPAAGAGADGRSPARRTHTRVQ